MAGGRASAAYGVIALLSWTESAKRKPSPKEGILRNPALCCGCAFVGVAIADTRAFANEFDQSPRLVFRMMTSDPDGWTASNATINIAKTLCSYR